MILSDQEIRAAVERHDLILDPLPPVDNFSPSAVDLRLASEIKVWDEHLTDPAGVDVTLSIDDLSLPTLVHYSKDAALETDGSFILRPRQFVLGKTVEKLGFPLDGGLAARVEGRSSLARLGLVIHLTAPTIHADFGGDAGSPIILEILNLGPFCLKMRPGKSSICQLIVEQVTGNFGTGLVSDFREQDNALGGVITPPTDSN